MFVFFYVTKYMYLYDSNEKKKNTFVESQSYDYIIEHVYSCIMKKYKLIQDTT